MIKEHSCIKCLKSRFDTYGIEPSIKCECGRSYLTVIYRVETRLKGDLTVGMGWEEVTKTEFYKENPYRKLENIVMMEGYKVIQSKEEKGE